MGRHKRLSDGAYEGLLNDWLDPATRSKVERAAWRSERLGDARLAALAAEHATRRSRQLRWQVVPSVALLLVTAAQLIVADPPPLAGALFGIAIMMTALSVPLTVLYARAQRVHESDADWASLRALAEHWKR